MGAARLDHHVGLRTADIDAAARFWVAALEGTLATRPVLRTGGYFDLLFGEGAQVKVCYVTFEAGAIELFEFVEPRVDVPASSQTATASCTSASPCRTSRPRSRGSKRPAGAGGSRSTTSAAGRMRRGSSTATIRRVMCSS